MTATRKWNIERDGVHYQAELTGIKFELWRHTGTRESAGGKLLTAHQILEGGKHYVFLENVFGHSELFEDILVALRAAQTEFEVRHPKL